jgi:hypothetical protein
MQRKSAKSASYLVAEFVEQKRRPASAGRFSLACIKIMIGKLGDLCSPSSQARRMHLSADLAQADLGAG